MTAREPAGNWSWLPSAPPSWNRLTIAIAALGAAVQDNTGTLTATALVWLTIAVAAVIMALFAERGTPSALYMAGTALCVLLSGVLAQGASVAGVLHPDQRFLFALLTAAMLGVGIATCVAPERHLMRLFVLLLALAALNAWWLITTLPAPGLDSLQFQRESAQALLAGRNPYAMTYADPYPASQSAQYYGPGVSVGGVLQFGYPYLPVSLLLALPGQLAGDVRYASLVAALLSAWFIANTDRSRIGFIAATLLLLSPAFPDMVVFGWSDTYALLLGTATWYCARRAPGLLPYVLGLFFASKQYTVVVAPALLLLVPRPWRVDEVVRFGLRVVATAVAVTLPFVLWDIPAFIHSTVLLQFRQPFRSDALSYLAWLDPSDPQRWMPLPFVLAAAAWGAILWRDRIRAVSFPLALSLVFIVFVSFNKQAFLNYYFLVIGCMCAALAAEWQESIAGAVK